MRWRRRCQGEKDGASPDRTFRRQSGLKFRTEESVRDIDGKLPDSCPETGRLLGAPASQGDLRTEHIFRAVLGDFHSMALGPGPRTCISEAPEVRSEGKDRAPFKDARGHRRPCPSCCNAFPGQTVEGLDAD